jgi:iron uptake system component EfeO
VALTACADKSDNAGDDTGPIAVTANDDSCDVGTTETKAGTVTFKVKNDGSKVTEFYVYAEGDRVMGEVENIAPGLSRELTVELTADEYQTACKPGMIGEGIRGDFTVTGEAAKLTEDEHLQEAVDTYKQYVSNQSESLLDKTQEFVDAVKAEDIDAAKELFPVARTYWERIEPVAEIFGDLDPKIDAREADFPKGPKDPAFTGFHKLEYDLWISKDVSKSADIADQLMTDVKEVVERAAEEELTPLHLANGAKELLDEVATGKITGEEDAYSHTDLWDFAANLEGSKNAITSLRPVLEERDPDLVAELDDQFDKAAAALDKHRDGDGWLGWDKLSKDELKTLSDAINALAEPVSEVAGVVADKK